jgi:hypothetical protein
MADSNVWECNHCKNLNVSECCLKCKNPRSLVAKPMKYKPKTLDVIIDENKGEERRNICNVCKFKVEPKHYGSYQVDTTCTNCGLDAGLEAISSKDYGKGPYKVLNKEDVNPTMVSVCVRCRSDKISSNGCQWQFETKCDNCGTSNPETKLIPKRDLNRGENMIKTREEVNPVMMMVCKLCRGKVVTTGSCQWDIGSECTSCKTTNPETFAIKQSMFDSGEHKIIPKEEVNPEMMYICEDCWADNIAHEYVDRQGYQPKCNRCKKFPATLKRIKRSEYSSE